MKKAIRIATAMATILFLTAMATAQTVPRLINYQGYLTDSAGKALDTKEYKLTFNIYDSPTPGTAATWGPQEFLKVPVVRGHFNVILGPTDTQNPARNIETAFASDKAYLEITVNDAASPILPRQQILSVPYAMRAEKADNATTADNAAQANNATTADHSKTTDKVLFEPDWIEPELLNGWKPYPGDNSAPHNKVKYAKDALGFVHLRGFLMPNSSSEIFVLDEGYRPEEFMIYNVLAVGNSPGVMLYVYNSGSVHTGGNKPLNGVSLNGVHFWVGH